MDDERVAALYDGKLDAPERDELLALIAADDDESWLLAEVSGVMADVEAHGPVSLPDAASGGDVGGDDARAADPPAVYRADSPPAPVAEDGGSEADGVIPITTHRPPEAPIMTTTDVDAPAREGDGVTSIESRRRSPAWPWLMYGAMAAALAGIGVTALLVSRSRAGRLDDPAHAVAMLERGAAPGLADGWETPWGATRGGGSGGDVPADEQVAVRVGARLFDLELAADTRNTAAVKDLSDKVAAELNQVGGGGITSRSYDQIVAGAPDVRGLMKQGRRDVRDRFAGEWLDLGTWAEAARTAAVRQDAAFFRHSTGERVLKSVENLPDADDATRNAIRDVRAALPVGSRANWKVLRGRLEDLLRVAGASLDDPPA